MDLRMNGNSSIRKVSLAVALTIAWTFSPALAGPQLIVSSDPRGAEVRAAAKEFYEKVAAGDAAGAKAMFDGPAEQAELLQAHLRFVVAGDELQRTLAAKFGKVNEQVAMFGRAMVQPRADQVAGEGMTLNGDRASMARVSPLDCGTDLRRVGGKWKVTHLTTITWKTASFTRFLNAGAAAADEVRGKVASGEVTSVASAQAEIEKQIRPEFLAFFQAEEPMATGAGPARTQPAPAPVASAVDLQQLIGKKFASPEVQRVFESLPGAPHVSTFSEPISALYLSSPELGLELAFHLPGGILTGVSLYAEGSSGFTQYPGTLPAGLSFADLRADAEKKLGPPPESGGGSVTPYHADYPEQGIDTTYAKLAAKDPANPIAYVSLFAPHAPAAAQPTTRPLGPRVTLRLVAANSPLNDPAVEMLPVAFGPDRGTTLPVSREVLIDERDILKLAGTVSDRDSHTAISIVITPESTKQFEKVTAANVHKRMALVFDGKVLVAPTISAPISNGKILIDLGSGGMSAGIDHLIGRLHAAVTALPSTSPSESAEH
jgi:hypothetical protein